MTVSRNRPARETRGWLGALDGTLDTTQLPVQEYLRDRQTETPPGAQMAPCKSGTSRRQGMAWTWV